MYVDYGAPDSSVVLSDHMYMSSTSVVYIVMPVYHNRNYVLHLF